MKYFVILFISLLAIAGCSISNQQDGCYESFIENEKINLIDVNDLYKMIFELEKRKCNELESDEFERIISNSQLNLVSFAVLEMLTVDKSPRESEAMIAEYVKAQTDALDGVTPSLVLTLVDIYYGHCRADEACINENITPLVAGLTLKEGAGCVFGMSDSCPEAPAGAPFIPNNATIARAVNSEALSKERSKFFCGRYGDCQPVASTGEKLP